MKARLDPEASPDEWGIYRIIDEDGNLLLRVDEAGFGDNTEQMAELIVAAINGELVQAPPLPEGWDGPLPELGWQATGAWLREHDLDGDAWERWIGEGWRNNHHRAWDLYLIRPVTPAAPPQPLTEEVLLHEVIGRRLPDEPRPIYGFHVDGKGVVFSCHGGGADGCPSGYRNHRLPLSPDGKVTVLVEDGA